MTQDITTTKHNKKHWKVGSLFSGVGGICLGFKKAGAEVVWANDCDTKANLTYKENFPHQLCEEKIENVPSHNIPDIDILTAGFPCTSFSVAGHQQGFEDERSGHLYFEVLRIVKAKHPQVVFLENVKNLLTHDSGQTFRVIYDSLLQEGYYIKYDVLNSMTHANVPQNRERTFIVAFRDFHAFRKFSFPASIPLTTKISDITNPTLKQDDRYYYKEYKPKGKNEDGTPKMVACQYYPMLSESMKNKDAVYQLRRIYVRENKSNVSPTLTANMGTGGHNVPLVIDDYGFRKFTPRECFLLQGFPKNYILPSTVAHAHLYKQAGNSVTVPLIQKIAQKILKVLDMNYSD